MAEALAANISWERMIRAVEKVRERTLRAAAALERHNVDYAVVGGNAVAAWVSTIDESVVRNTRDVDVLLRRGDFAAAKTALESAGFISRHAASIDMFLDGPGTKAGDAVHILYAGELVKSDQPTPNPDVTESEAAATGYRVVALKALVQMKLNSFRLKDQVHLQDMIGVGLIDMTWPARYPPVLAARLQQVLDNPDG